METERCNANENSVYKGKIVDQFVGATSQGEAQVILTVNILGRLKNPQDLSEGIENCQI